MKAKRNRAWQAIQPYWCHPKKRHLCPELCMTSDLVCTECGLKSIFETLARPLHTHTTQVFVAGQPSFPSWDCVWDSVYTVKAFSVFLKMPTRKWDGEERSRWKDPTRILSRGLWRWMAHISKQWGCTKTTSTVMTYDHDDDDDGGVKLEKEKQDQRSF